MKKLLAITLVVLFAFLSLAFKVVMVTDVGGLGDKSFNDGTWAGVQRAAKDLGVDADIIQSKEQTDYIPNLTNAAKEADVVIAVGFLMSDALFKVAPQFPDTKFIGIDIAPSAGQEVPDNVVLFLFKEQETAFFVGYLAAAMTKTSKVGFVGGMPIPPVKRFEFGYRAGVKAYNQLHRANVEVLIGYTNNFNDPASGKQFALSQFKEGADIIFAAAGACGNGVIDAAKEKTYALFGLKEGANLAEIIDKYYEMGKAFFAIGVDSDQDYMAPGTVLASAMKRVDQAAYMGIKWAFLGRFKGGVYTLGVKEKGVGLSPMKYTKGLVPARILAEIEYLGARIRLGYLKVPASETELEEFDVSDVSFPF